jgi:hypothetical protein
MDNKQALYQCLENTVSQATAGNLSVKLFSVDTASAFGIELYIQSDHGTADILFSDAAGTSNAIGSGCVRHAKVASDYGWTIWSLQDNGIRTYYAQFASATNATVRKEMKYGEFTDLLTAIATAPDTIGEPKFTLVGESLNYITNDILRISKIEPTTNFATDTTSVGTAEHPFDKIYVNDLTIKSSLSGIKSLKVGDGTQTLFVSSEVDSDGTTKKTYDNYDGSRNLFLKARTLTIKDADATSDQNDSNIVYDPFGTEDKAITINHVASAQKVDNILTWATDATKAQETDKTFNGSAAKNIYFRTLTITNGLSSDSDKETITYDPLKADTIEQSLTISKVAHATTAGKLATAVSLWGNQFDGSGDATGPIEITTTNNTDSPISTNGTGLVTNLNADLLDGLHASTSSTASTVVARNASNQILINSIAFDNGASSTSTISSIQLGNYCKIYAGGTGDYIDLGSNGYISSTSDRRMKTIYSDESESQWVHEFVRNVHVYDYVFNGTDQHKVGVMAQDMKANIPDRFANQFVNISDESEKGGFKDQMSINKEDLVFILLAEVQRQSKEIDELKAQLAAK